MSYCENCHDATDDELEHKLVVQTIRAEQAETRCAEMEKVLSLVRDMMKWIDTAAVTNNSTRLSHTLRLRDALAKFPPKESTEKI